jgi:hypothetical protein
MFVQALRSSKEKRCVVVPGDLELAVGLVVLDELDSLPDTWQDSVRACRMACWRPS